MICAIEIPFIFIIIIIINIIILKGLFPLLCIFESVKNQSYLAIEWRRCPRREPRYKDTAKDNLRHNDTSRTKTANDNISIIVVKANIEYCSCD